MYHVGGLTFLLPHPVPPAGDECSIAALDKLAEGDRTDLEALLMSGALNHSTPLDLDLLVNGLIDEVDELGVSDLDHPAEVRGHFQFVGRSCLFPLSHGLWFAGRGG